jgi:hypothetical protein
MTFVDIPGSAVGVDGHEDEFANRRTPCVTRLRVFSEHLQRNRYRSRAKPNVIGVDTDDIAQIDSLLECHIVHRNRGNRAGANSDACNRSGLVHQAEDPAAECAIIDIHIRRRSNDADDRGI